MEMYLLLVEIKLILFPVLSLDMMNVTLLEY